MHWSETLARQIIERNPDKEEYVCATGISPSGSIHLGNFRDIATSHFVVLALHKLGKKARLMHSWDDFDRLRKVPANVANVAPDMVKHIGRALADIPNPFADVSDAPTYAAYFEREFSESLEALGIMPDYRYQADMYRAGKYTSGILLAMKERGRIFDILDSFRTQDAVEGERDSYYPVAIYCPECRRDTTTIQNYDDETHIARYTCKCGHQAEFDIGADFDCKLAWKVDWAMRWGFEGVDFEPGGPDHAAPSGSYQTSRIIAKEIFGIDAPLFQSYSFIGLKGATGKMSGSTGLNLTPGKLLKIYEPEVMLWLYSKADPMHSFDFFFDDGILRQYTEFDRMYNSVKDGTANEAEQAIMHYCTINGRTLNTVSMSWLVQFGSVVNFSPSVLETVFTKIGTPYKASEFAGRLELAKNWLEMCSPESVNRLCAHRNWAVYEALPEDGQKEIAALHDNLRSNEYTLDELGAMIYAVPAQVLGPIDDAKRKKTLQAAFFKNVYRLLIGKEQGPRLYLFLYALERSEYLHLLDFSTPKTEAEIAAGNMHPIG
jgi:lysyl-tRNA synthetase class 1